MDRAKFSRLEKVRRCLIPREVQNHVISSVSCHEVVKDDFGQEYLLKEYNRN